MANGIERDNGMTVDCGEQMFYPAGKNSANVYVTEPKDGMVFIAVKVNGVPWASNVLDKDGKVLKVERRGIVGRVDKLPSQVFASTGGAVKLNQAGQTLSLNVIIPADYGKVEKTKRESATLAEAFKGWKHEAG